MKKRYLVAIIGQSVAIGLLLIFAYIQKLEADAQREKVNWMQNYVEEIQEKAEVEFRDNYLLVKRLNKEVDSLKLVLKK